MKTLAAAALLTAIASPAFAGYGHYGHYAPTYHAPVYHAPVTKVVCFDEKVFVPGYYGGHFVIKRVCKTVAAY